MPPRKKQPPKLSLKEQWQAMGNLPRFLRLIWETQPTMTLWNIGLRLVAALLPLAILYVGKEIIDTVIALMEDNQMSKTYLWYMLGLEAGLVIVQIFLRQLIQLIDGLLGDLFSNHTSEKIIHHAATLDLYQFENADFYDKMERARQQTNSRTVLLSLVLTQLQELISLLSLALGLIVFSPWLIILLIIAVIPTFIGEMHFNMQSYSLTRSWTQERRELDYLRFLGASNTAAKEVKIFNLARFLAQRFKTLAHEYYLANRKLIIKKSTWAGLLSALGSLAYYGAYVVIILQTIQGLITLGTLTFLSGTFKRMQSGLQGIMLRFSQISSHSLYLTDLFDFFEIQPTIKQSAEMLPFPNPIKEGFRFENVGFKYPGSNIYAIKNISFTIGANEKIALVGENGAGKTTLIKLLSRLYDPSEGKIYVDNIPLDRIQLDDLRKNIGIIFQDYIRLDFTAKENIAIGNIDIISKNQKNGHQLNDIIDYAAEKSLASEVVSELPNGIDQMLGRRFNDGVELSGGQWQKIALARAYVRDAQLFILDEPTSALDARAEHEVFERFTELMVNKSAVIISHRFSTVRMADRILFLEHGQLIEEGSHDELIDIDGKYAELYGLQAKGYQ
ncbi:ABC transporter ATP-binding protein [Membranihabitans marinus]|uniref:ABC transporter ATP-binding protein n=1 Tax=Membranihabitans marinus TaxID=1227546 RepID=UPI001F24B9C1|nr:ABC transporter ATP-binding protein [Membranihabitans marinus]